MCVSNASDKNSRFIISINVATLAFVSATGGQSKRNNISLSFYKIKEIDRNAFAYLMLLGFNTLKTISFSHKKTSSAIKTDE